MSGWGDGGMTDAFLAEFNSSGTLLAYSSVFRSRLDLEVSDLAVTTEGVVLLAGHYIGQAAYAVPNKTVNEATPVYSEGFVAVATGQSNVDVDGFNRGRWERRDILNLVR